MLLPALLALAAAAEVQPTQPPVIELPTPSNRNPTEVHFLAYRGEDEYEVTVGKQSCRTPCTLSLPPGPTKVTTTGTGEIEAQMVIPHLTSQVRLSHGAPRWFTPTGAVFVPLGLVIGASMWAIGLTCGFGPGSGGCLAVNVIAWPVFGLGMTITGAVLLGMGSKTAPLDANRPEILDARKRQGLKLEGIALAPLPGGVGGGLGFSF